MSLFFFLAQSQVMSIVRKINRSQKGVNNVDAQSIILKSGLARLQLNILKDMEHL